MAISAERTGKTVWVVRVEYANGNKRYFGFEDEKAVAQFRSEVLGSGVSIKRVQPFEVPIYELVEK